jgi:hypothetical protein
MKRRNERGAAPLELALGVGLLMIPVALAVLSFGPWMERRTFARLAAAEASRSVVVDDGATRVAFDQIAAMATNHGFDLDAVRIGLCGATPRALSAGGASACPLVLTRGSSVVARVEVDVPLIVLPWRDGSGNRAAVGGVVTSFEHESFVDLYRSTG